MYIINDRTTLLPKSHPNRIKLYTFKYITFQYKHLIYCSVEVPGSNPESHWSIAESEEHLSKFLRQIK